MLEILNQLQNSTLEHKYRHELHCNELLLLPYYIAAQNIEHEFYDRTQNYAPFEGLCFADNLEMEANKRQASMFVPENAQRVQQQQDAPIFVIIGNPPYNVGQQNENDNNKIVNIRISMRGFVKPMRNRRKHRCKPNFTICIRAFFAGPPTASAITMG